MFWSVSSLYVAVFDLSDALVCSMDIKPEAETVRKDSIIIA